MVNATERVGGGVNNKKVQVPKNMPLDKTLYAREQEMLQARLSFLDKTLGIIGDFKNL